MSHLKEYPIVFSILVILPIYLLLGKLPIEEFFIQQGFSQVDADRIEDLILTLIAFTGVYLILRKQNIPHQLNGGSYHSLLYYLPLLVYLFMFSGGLPDFSTLATTEKYKIVLYGIQTFGLAYLEEFLFRGLVLGLFLLKYKEAEHGVFKALLFSSLIFGMAHLMNYWSYEGVTLQVVFNQVYATACVGFLFGVVYLKTRSILLLGLLHFASNFISGLEGLDAGLTASPVVNEPEPFLTLVLEEFLQLIFFGIPLFIGLTMLTQTKKEDVQQVLA